MTGAAAAAHLELLSPSTATLDVAVEPCHLAFHLSLCSERTLDPLAATYPASKHQVHQTAVHCSKDVEDANGSAALPPPPPALAAHRTAAWAATVSADVSAPQLRGMTLRLESREVLTVRATEDLLLHLRRLVAATKKPNSYHGTGEQVKRTQRANSAHNLRGGGGGELMGTLVLHNECPAAFVCSQTGSDGREAVLLPPGARTKYVWRHPPQLSPPTARRWLRLAAASAAAPPLAADTDPGEPPWFLHDGGTFTHHLPRLFILLTTNHRAHLSALFFCQVRPWSPTWARSL